MRIPFLLFLVCGSAWGLLMEAFERPRHHGSGEVAAFLFYMGIFAILVLPCPLALLMGGNPVATFGVTLGVQGAWTMLGVSRFR